MEQKRIIVLPWQKDAHHLFNKAGIVPVYIIDSSIPKNSFDKLVAECEVELANYIIINDINNINTVFALCSYLEEHFDDYNDVISCCEKTQFAASIINWRVFGRMDVADSLIASRDKRSMKAKVGKITKTAKYISLIDFKENSLELNFPAISKPVNKCGSTNTNILNNINELSDVYNTNKSCLTEYIVEEFVTGEEYNVDAIWLNGKIEYLFIGKYIVPRIYGYMNRINKLTAYLPYVKNEELYHKIEPIMIKIVSELGFKTGITHSEFFINDFGDITLGEIATRHAGGGMSAAIKEGVGESLVELGIRARLGYFEGAPKERRIRTKHVGFIDLRPDMPGYIKTIIQPSALMGVDGIVNVDYRVKEGDFFQSDGRDNWCVLVTVAADTEEEFNSIIAKAQKMFFCEVSTFK